MHRGRRRRLRRQKVDRKKRQTEDERRKNARREPLGPVVDEIGLEPGRLDLGVRPGERERAARRGAGQEGRVRRVELGVCKGIVRSHLETQVLGDQPHQDGAPDLAFRDARGEVRAALSVLDEPSLMLKAKDGRVLWKAP